MSERTSFVSLLAAAVVAITGLIPVIWLLTTPSQEAPADAEVAVVETTATWPEETTVVVEPIPELDVDELNESVVRVLQANGYAELTPESGLEEQLPDAVTRVLIDNGAVLTVVEEDPAAEGGE